MRVSFIPSSPMLDKVSLNFSHQNIIWINYVNTFLCAYQLFLIEPVVLLSTRVLCTFYIQVLSQIYVLQTLCSHSVAYLFTFLLVSFEALKFWILLMSSLSFFFSFIDHAFGVISMTSVQLQFKISKIFCCVIL